jgi:hypothetical protein
MAADHRFKVAAELAVESLAKTIPWSEARRRILAAAGRASRLEGHTHSKRFVTPETLD